MTQASMEYVTSLQSNRRRSLDRAASAAHYEEVAEQAAALSRIDRYLTARDTRVGMSDHIQAFDAESLRVSDIRLLRQIITGRLDARLSEGRTPVS